MRNTRNTRIAESYALFRKEQRDTIAKALGNINISEVDIDRICVRKLRNTNLLEGLFKK